MIVPAIPPANTMFAILELPGVCVFLRPPHPTTERVPLQGQVTDHQAEKATRWLIAENI